MSPIEYIVEEIHDTMQTRMPMAGVLVIYSYPNLQPYLFLCSDVE